MVTLFSCKHQTWLILWLHMTLVKLLSSKYILKIPLNSFYDLESLIHVLSIFIDYWIGAAPDHCLKQSRDFSKTINIYKVNLHGYCPNSFLVPLWALSFKVLGTRFLHFCQIPKWINCRSPFWRSHMALVKIWFL